jgi:hypothetical protein
MKHRVLMSCRISKIRRSTVVTGRCTRKTGVGAYSPLVLKRRFLRYIDHCKKNQYRSIQQHHERRRKLAQPLPQVTYRHNLNNYKNYSGLQQCNVFYAIPSLRRLPVTVNRIGVTSASHGSIHRLYRRTNDECPLAPLHPQLHCLLYASTTTTSFASLKTAEVVVDRLWTRRLFLFKTKHH